MRAAGLSLIEWRVLATLHANEALTVSALAQEVLSRQPTVTELVQAHVRAGLGPAAGRCGGPATHAGGGNGQGAPTGEAVGEQGAQP
ncbi:MAG: MarR family transcriptional regulator [Bdellovibrionales bacterium]|nr:MarR family transcriptional regulator [Ramlibacter sp.]